MTAEELTKIAVIEQEARAQYRHSLNVCVAAGCLSSRSDLVKEALEKEIGRRGLERHCQVRGVGCLGLCSEGPLVNIESKDKPSVMYQGVSDRDVPEIVSSLEAEPVQRLICPTDRPFFKSQKKIVLENCGSIDPERIEEYIAAGGYEALHWALTTMEPEEVIEQITRSGLRGRGGAGFPTGLKWSTVYKADGSQGKYVICNADEGDPGAFMDRSVLESDPHRVLEGMAIAAYAVGAKQGYIYVRAEYPLAVKRLKTAIRQADRLGLLGNSIFGTPFSFTVDVRLGAGAFVCGEETALIASIEGKRGQPRPRPPFPAERGLWGCPTLINNVETFANVPPIIRNGPEWFASIGTEKSKGTKVFALAGRVNNTGLIEVPMGMTLRQIIYEIGGGIPEGKKFKAVQTGGPSGGCIPEQFLDMPVDYESLAKVGSIMGSGGMIVMDETSSMVDVARFFMEFCKDESCGKCVPCRVGTAQMLDLLDKFVKKRATARDLELLEELCDMVKHTSLCGLGQSAPNPVLTTLKYFRNEYNELLAASEQSGSQVEGRAEAQEVKA
ncbi:NADH-quinone oxidoreductase subunit NuoF [Fontivita pretiosa]|uniref:NADH-quinone oxidoreductase subunit NuoF n=1 Tax=Fontivita pretiosa TaxID=2989684 RepID=UPI003D17D121